MTITKTTASRRATRALSKASLTCAAALSAAAGIGAAGGSRASADHVPYEIDRLGFIDSPHTPSTGSRINNVVSMNAVGNVIGNQVRFDTSDPNGSTAWFFGPAGLERIGLFEDHAHVSSTGVQISNALFLNDAGHAAGTSNRYINQFGAPGAEQSGQSAWVYFNGTTTQIGLTEGVHKTADGIQISDVVALNALGHAIGNSERYDATGNSFGYSAYLAVEGSSTRIGLDVNTGGAHEHRRSDGQEVSNAQFLNDLGDAAGFSKRYVQGDPDSVDEIGQSAWIRLADGATKKLGFTTTEYTRNATNGVGPNDGKKDSSVVALNNAGDAVGHSERYNGTTGASLGQTAWVQRRAETAPVRIGLYSDDEHVRGTGTPTDGETSSTVQKFNDHGYATGFSTRYNNTTPAGQSAWLFSGANGTERVGLIDDQHTGTFGTTAGYRSSTATVLTSKELEPGNPDSTIAHVAGTAIRFSNTNVQAGQSAWVHTEGDSASTRIGLFETDETVASEFTRSSNKEQFSSVVAMNTNGVVVGHSRRYRDGMLATQNNGQAAWIYDVAAATTPITRIGLFDDAHTRAPGLDDDFQHTEVKFVNEEGHAAGISWRYNANAEQAGQSGWYYDGTSSHMLVFSTDTSANNRTFTEISYLTDTGIVIGYYERYGAEAGNRAYLWDSNIVDDLGTATDERFHDLGLLVDGGLSANGWESLNSALQMSGAGHILGVGTLTPAGGDGSMPFLLTPVPEPASIALLAMTGLALLPRRRRR